MPLFTNTYPSQAPEYMARFLTHAEGHYLISNTEDGSAGLRSLDLTGKPLWARRFAHPEIPLVAFHDVKLTPKGSIYVLGSVSAPGPGKHLYPFVMEINSEGAVLRTRMVAAEHIRYVQHLHVTTQGELMITGWHTPPGTSQDDFFVLKLDEKWKSPDLKKFSLGKDDQLGCSILFNDELYLFGTQHSGVFRGFALALNNKLDVRAAAHFSVPGHKLVNVSHAVEGPDGRLRLLAEGLAGNQRVPVVLDTLLDGDDFVFENVKVVEWPEQGYTFRNLAYGDGLTTIVAYQKGKPPIITSLYAGTQEVTAHRLDLPLAGIRYLCADAGARWLGGEAGDDNLNLLFVATNIELEGCELTATESRQYVPSEANAKGMKPTATALEASLKSLTLAQDELPLVVKEHCPSPTGPTPLPPFNPEKDYRLQSPYLNLQAAGSTGQESSPGVHLRWFLNGNLGDNHFPKGNLATTTNFYNKPDDFVRIYRAAYQPHEDTGPEIGFHKHSIRSVDHATATWQFTVESQAMEVEFLDTSAYNSVRSDLNIDPLVDPRSFFNAYAPARFRVRLLGSLAVEVECYLSGAAASVKIETYSTANLYPNSTDAIVSSRYVLTPASASRVINAENIQYIECEANDGSALLSIRFVTYKKLLHYADLTPVGAFALTTDQNTAFNRLEDSNGLVHNKWHQYDPTAKVAIKNYQDRWHKDKGLGWGVAQYITRSETDPAAVIDDYDVDLSLFNLLTLSSLNFHNARMLGLGTSDVFPIKATEQRFIYVAEYVTLKSPQDFSVAEKTRHVYVSLPTATTDQRMPLDIDLQPITYGLTVDNGTAKPLQITDAEGYLPRHHARYAGLRATLKADPAAAVSFFNPATPFSLAEYSYPVFFSLRKRLQGASAWANPAPAAHDYYKDYTGRAEQQGIFFNDDPVPVHYTDEITLPGYTEYAAAAVNIFSRTGRESASVTTDETIFKPFRTLLPPANVRSRLIQKESALLLSTAAEQALLETVTTSNSDTLCCIDFNYTAKEDNAYAFGNGVEIFYRREEARVVIGAVTTVLAVSGNDRQATLRTGDYTEHSISVVTSPVIDQQDLFRFTGGNLTYREENYRVIAVKIQGGYPEITVEKNEARTAAPNSGNRYLLNQSFADIPFVTNEPFLLTEPLTVADNWTDGQPHGLNKFPFTVDLVQDNWTEKTESVTVPGSDPASLKTRGVWGGADIVPVLGSGMPTGLYEVTFNGFKLPQHPQKKDITDPAESFSVDWHAGKIRLRTTGDLNDDAARKELDVVSIENPGSGWPLKLLVADPAYDITTPDNNVRTGVGQLVNFHPGYRVWIRQDDSIGFNAATLLPLPDEGVRRSFIGLRTVDTTTPDPLVPTDPMASLVSTPSLLAAREIQVPAVPEIPLGAAFATPVDVFNRATYSFVSKFSADGGRKPWGAIFYRISLDTVLSVLYSPETARMVKQELPPSTADEFYTNRWVNVLSFDYADDEGLFKEYPPAPGKEPYRLPPPDNASLTKPDPVNSDETIPLVGVELEAVLKVRIQENCVPLTEQPLLFKYLKGGSYVPQPGKQVTRDKNGGVLSPDDTDFDQSPMAKKIDDHTVRFTDFTLAGNQHPEAAYFYTVRELSNAMQVSEFGPFLGPVRLLNTRPPDKLIVTKVEAPYPGPTTNYLPAVKISFNAPTALQGIQAVEILRTSDPAKALNERHMQAVKTVTDLTPTANGRITAILDDFADVPDTEIPFATPLFYRIRGVRKIEYTDEQDNPREMTITGKASAPLLTNIVDTVHPTTPELAIINRVLSADEEMITELSLSWSKTCHNGKYRLYWLNAYRNWEEILLVDGADANDPAKLHCDLTALTNNPFMLPQEYIPANMTFRVEAENSSGMRNSLEERSPLVVTEN